MRKFNLTQREAYNGMLYAAVPVTGFAVFFVVPFVISIVRSFQSGLNPRFVGLQNYISVFQSESFLLAASNTLKFIGIGVPTIMVVSLLIALMLNFVIEKASFFRTIFLMPYVIPVASAVMFFQILFERSGVVNTLLLGDNRVDFLHTDSAFFILLLLYIWKNFGYNMILFLSGLTQIPREYYDAARVDGAGSWNTFRFVTFPMLMPTFFFVFIISIVNSFKVFREAYALGGQYPHTSIYMLQHFMNNNFQNLNYQRLSVSSVYVFLIIFIIVLVLYNRQRKAGDNQL